MREDSELPTLPDVMTVKEVAERLDISERMVHTYVQDGRLPAHKFGKSTAIKSEDFEAFERAKKGRPRTRLPVWRKSVGDNLQYQTILTASLKAGQSKNLDKKLDEFHAGKAYMMPGTVVRSVGRGVERPDEVHIVLTWRSTVMPKDDARKAAIEALKNELAGILDWEGSRDIYDRILLHT